MKHKKPFKLKTQNIYCHEIFSEVEPFFINGLTDVLKFQRFKINPCLTKIFNIFPGFSHFFYRIDSKKLIGHNDGQSEVHFVTVYHEGLHNLVGLRFGTSLKNRPVMTLLNECIGTGLEIYLWSTLARTTNFELTGLEYPKGAEKLGNALGQSFQEKFQLAQKDPFSFFKGTIKESFAIHKGIFDLLTCNKKQKNKILLRLCKKLASTKYLLFISNADVTVPALFVAQKCGHKSSREDILATRKCLETLEDSKSMEDFLVKLGVKNYSVQIETKSA